MSLDKNKIVELIKRDDPLNESQISEIVGTIYQVYKESISSLSPSQLRMFVLNNCLTPAGEVSVSWFGKTKNSDVIKAQLASLYPNLKSLSEQIYWLTEGLTDYPVTCSVCGNKVTKYLGFKHGYKPDFCTSKCAASSPKTQEKRKQKSMEKYGVDHHAKTTEQKQKIKNTCLERYGTEHHWANPEIREKAKATNLERYGVEYVLQSPVVKEKIVATNLQKYGTK